MSKATGSRNTPPTRNVKVSSNFLTRIVRDARSTGLSPFQDGETRATPDSAIGQSRNKSANVNNDLNKVGESLNKNSFDAAAEQVNDTNPQTSLSPGDQLKLHSDEVNKANFKHENQVSDKIPSELKLERNSNGSEKMESLEKDPILPLNPIFEKQNRLDDEKFLGPEGATVNSGEQNENFENGASQLVDRHKTIRQSELEHEQCSRESNQKPEYQEGYSETPLKNNTNENAYKHQDLDIFADDNRSDKSADTSASTSLNKNFLGRTKREALQENSKKPKAPDLNIEAADQVRKSRQTQASINQSGTSSERLNIGADRNNLEKIASDYAVEPSVEDNIEQAKQIDSRQSDNSAKETFEKNQAGKSHEDDFQKETDGMLQKSSVGLPKQDNYSKPIFNKDASQLEPKKAKDFIKTDSEVEFEGLPKNKVQPLDYSKANFTKKVKIQREPSSINIESIDVVVEAPARDRKLHRSSLSDRVSQSNLSESSHYLRKL